MHTPTSKGLRAGAAEPHADAPGSKHPSDPASSLLLREVVEQLLRYVPAQAIRAVLLTGSYARGQQDALSDLDLLVITHQNEKPTSATFESGGVEVELSLLTEDACRKQLAQSVPDNNNYILNTLSDALVLRDPEGVGQVLVDTAKALFSSPAAIPSLRERCQAKAALERLARSAQRHTRRMDRDKTATAVFARMRIDLLFSRSIYLACWSRGIRTTALPSLCERVLAEEGDFNDLARKYLATSSLKEQAELAQQLCAMTLTLLACSSSSMESKASTER